MKKTEFKVLILLLIVAMIFTILFRDIIGMPETLNMILCPIFSIISVSIIYTIRKRKIENDKTLPP